MSLFMGLHFDVISLQGLYSTFSLYSVLHVFIIPFSPMSTFCLFIFLFKFIQGLVVYLFYFVESFLRKVIETLFGFKSNLTASPPVTLFTILNFCPGDSRLALTLSSYSLQSKTLSNPMPPCLVFCASFSKARLYAWTKLLSLIQIPLQSETLCLVLDCLSKALSPIQGHLQSKSPCPVQNSLPSPRLCPLQVSLHS